MRSRLVGTHAISGGDASRENVNPTSGNPGGGIGGVSSRSCISIGFWLVYGKRPSRHHSDHIEPSLDKGALSIPKGKHGGRDEPVPLENPVRARRVIPMIVSMRPPHVQGRTRQIVIRTCAILSGRDTRVGFGLHIAFRRVRAFFRLVF